MNHIPLSVPSAQYPSPVVQLNVMNSCSKNMKFVFRFWLPFVLWLGVIFAFSSNPTTRASEIHWQDFIIKKTAHIVEYFIFSLLLYRALLNSGVRSKRIFAFIVFTAFLYGMSDEFHQSFTPGRDPQPRDVMFDATGSILFVYFYNKILVKNEKLLKYAKMIQLGADGKQETLNNKKNNNN